MKEILKSSTTKEKLYSHIFYWRNIISFFIFGTINNMVYVIVISAAQDISEQFEMDDYIALIPWSIIAFGFVGQVANTFLLCHIPHVYRIIVAQTLSTMGLLVVAFSGSFWLSLLGIVFVGIACTFGESVMLGFLKFFPSRYVAGWGSGTGMAGLGGTLIYMLFAAIEFDIMTSFLCLTPLGLIYILTMLFLVKKPSPEVLREEKEKELLENASKKPLRNNHQSSQGNTEDYGEDLPNSGLKTEGWVKRIWRIFRHTWHHGLQLLLMYTFQYVIWVGAASKALSIEDRESERFELKHSYIILGFCIQIGVFIMRSSVNYFKIRKTYILVVIQFFNFLLWSANAYWKFLPVYLQFPLAAIVGMTGGACYVNIYYNLLTDKRLNEADQEVGINFTAISVTFGIILSSVMTLIANHTIFVGK